MSCLTVRRVSHRRCSEERLSGVRSWQCVWLHPYMEGLKCWSWWVTGDSHRDEVALFESRNGEWGKKGIGVTAWLQKKLPYGTPQGLVTSARVLRRRSWNIPVIWKIGLDRNSRAQPVIASRKERLKTLYIPCKLFWHCGKVTMEVTNSRKRSHTYGHS